MNWLVGRNKQQEPETPVHRWAINAFKAALGSDTPLHAPVLSSAAATPVPVQEPVQQVVVEETAPATQRARASSTASILKTPGATKEQRKSVTFEAMAPLVTSRSGLPQSFPGKFPSPWIARDEEHAKASSEEEEPAASPSMGREAPLNRFGGKRQLSTTSLFNDIGPRKVSERVATPARTQPVSKSAETPKLRTTTQSSMPWTVDRGFQDLLAGFTRNNTTLQQMIAEMQDSCANAQAEARMTVGAGAAFAGTDSNATLTLDEPRSRSGQFWKQKFESLSGLSQTIQREQDIMQGKLLRLRDEVEARVEAVAVEWRDRCAILRDELDRERQAAKALPSAREVRGCRQRIKELEQQVSEMQHAANKSEAAELKLEALEGQLKAAEEAAAKALVRQATPASAPVHASTQSLIQPVLMSATAQRLAQATNDARGHSKMVAAPGDRSTTAPVHRALDGRGHQRGLSRDGATSTLASQRRTLLASRRQALQQADKGIAQKQETTTMTAPALHRGLSDPSMSPPAVPLHVLADQGKSVFPDACPSAIGHAASPRKGLGTLDANRTNTLSNRATTRRPLSAAIKPVIVPEVSEFKPDVLNLEDAAQRRREAAQRRLDERRRAQAKSSFHKDVSLARPRTANKENL
jgi:hypothetical protein